MREEDEPRFQGSDTDEFVAVNEVIEVPKLAYKTPDDSGLIEIYVNDKLVAEWAYEDEPEHTFAEFEKVFNAGFEAGNAQ